MSKLNSWREDQSGKIGVLAIVLIVVVCVAVIGLLLLGLGGWFVYQKAKEAGLNTELLSENPGVAVAKMVAAVNPNLEVVSVDETSRKVTLRDKESNKTVTVSLEELAQGKISFETEEGETSTLAISEEDGQGSVRLESSEGKVEVGQTSGKLPDWIPLYPGATMEGGMAGLSAEGKTGQAVLSTSDSPEKVRDFYSEALKQTGFEVNTIDPDGPQGQGAIVNAIGANDRKQVIVVIGTGKGGTTASVSFTETN